MSIQNIPLNKLRLSPHNVRKTGAEDNLDELVANIEAHGVLQNLIGGAARKRRSSIFSLAVAAFAHSTGLPHRARLLRISVSR